MLGLGSNITGISKVGTTIVTDNLVLRHNYNLSGVEPLSSGAAVFNGTSDYIGIGDIGAVKSLAFWFNPGIAYTNSVDGDRIIAFAGSSYLGITMGAATGGLTGEVLTVLPDSSSRTATTTTFTANTWYHVCISWNASNGYFDIYIDGLLSTDLSTGTHTLSNWDNFNVGTDNTGGTHFGGYMCNIGVWSAALSQAQVKSIMNKNYDSLSASEKTDLVSWWNLDSVIPDTTTLVYDNHHGGGDILGSELLTNGDFNTSGTLVGNSYALGWRSGDSGLTISNGVLNLYSDGSGFVGRAYATNGIDSYSNVLITGKTYEISYEVTENIDNSTLYAYMGAFIAIDKTVGIHTTYITATTHFFLFRNAGSDTTIKLDNVSVKLINGNTGTLS